MVAPWNGAHRLSTFFRAHGCSLSYACCLFIYLPWFVGSLYTQKKVSCCTACSLFNTVHDCKITGVGVAVVESKIIVHNDETGSRGTGIAIPNIFFCLPIFALFLPLLDKVQNLSRKTWNILIDEHWNCVIFILTNGTVFLSLIWLILCSLFVT